MRKKMKISIHKCSKVGWEDLPEDILVMIFSRLDQGRILFRTAYAVCRWWRSVARLMAFQRGDGYLNFWLFHYISVDQTHQFIKLLDLIVDGWQNKSQSITRITFPDSLYLSEDHLYYLAQRLPNLQSLCLPYTTTSTPTGYSRAIRFWKEMRKLNIGPMKSSYYIPVIKEVGINCRNLEYLAIHATHREEIGDNALVIDEYASGKIANNLCKVKTLYFLNCMFNKMGLENLMNKCACIEEISVMCCKHAASHRFHPRLEGFASYKLKKRTTKDNTIEWSISLNPRGRGDAYFSVPYVLRFLW